MATSYKSSLLQLTKEQTERCYALNGISTANSYLPLMDMSEHQAQARSLETLQQLIEAENNREMLLAHCESNHERAYLDSQFEEERHLERNKIEQWLPTIKANTDVKSAPLLVKIPECRQMTLGSPKRKKNRKARKVGPLIPKEPSPYMIRWEPPKPQPKSPKRKKKLSKSKSDNHLSQKTQFIQNAEPVPTQFEEELLETQVDPIAECVKESTDEALDTEIKPDTHVLDQIKEPVVIQASCQAIETDIEPIEVIQPTLEQPDVIPSSESQVEEPVLEALEEQLQDVIPSSETQVEEPVLEALEEQLQDVIPSSESQVEEPVLEALEEHLEHTHVEEPIVIQPEVLDTVEEMIMIISVEEKQTVDQEPEVECDPQDKIEENVEIEASVLDVLNTIVQEIEDEPSADVIQAILLIQRVIRGYVGRMRFQRKRHHAASASGILGAMPGTTQGTTGWYQDGRSLQAYYFDITEEGEWLLRARFKCDKVMLTLYDMNRYILSRTAIY